MSIIFDSVQVRNPKTFRLPPVSPVYEPTVDDRRWLAETEEIEDARRQAEHEIEEEFRMACLDRYAEIV